MLSSSSRPNSEATSENPRSKANFVMHCVCVCVCVCAIHRVHELVARTLGTCVPLHNWGECEQASH